MLLLTNAREAIINNRAARVIINKGSNNVPKFITKRRKEIYSIQPRDSNSPRRPDDLSSPVDSMLQTVRPIPNLFITLNNLKIVPFSHRSFSTIILKKIYRTR